MEITGMTCGGCVNRVRTALAKSPGVKYADVKIGEAKVAFDPGVTNSAALRAVVTHAGYGVAAA